MAEIDGQKEEIVYLRFWLGIMVVTEISLVGWLASAIDSASPRLLTLAIIGMIVLGIGIFLKHRQIERRIEQIRAL